MSRISKYTAEQKIRAVLDYKNGLKTKKQIYDELNISYTSKSLSRWVTRYELYGEQGLINKNCNKSYDKDFKIKVVQEYLQGNTTFEKLANKYNVSASGVISTWVKKYTNEL